MTRILRECLRPLLLLLSLSPAAVLAACSRAEEPPEAPVETETAAAAPAGQEAAESLPACVDLAGPDAERHLVRGWNGPEKGGRWTQQTGLAVLGTRPEGRATLVLQGASFRTDIPRVTVSLAQRRVLESSVTPGPFRLTTPVDQLPASGRVEVEISSDPVFLPAEHGINDNRSLGLFLHSICLQGEDAPGSAPAVP